MDVRGWQHRGLLLAVQGRDITSIDDANGSVTCTMTIEELVGVSSTAGEVTGVGDHAELPVTSITVPESRMTLLTGTSSSRRPTLVDSTSAGATGRTGVSGAHPPHRCGQRS